MKVRIIVQARLTSSRLPGKALLPVAGYPSAILAALRGSNRKHDITFATSADPSDDVLALQAARYGLEVFRGPLNDVLARYAFAAAGLPGDSIVVRLTGDNVVPDGSFVNELIGTLVETRAEYVGVNACLAGIPYGVSGEAFTVAVLLKAHRAAVSCVDREHVGLWMKRNCRAEEFRPKLTSNEHYGHLRCTIDTEQDYKRMVWLFEDTPDPLRVGWRDLTRKLATTPDCSASHVPSRNVSGTLHSELTLGTAQLGMPYGRVNDSGKPITSVAVSIVNKALAFGVNGFDTARGYGESEAVLGEAFSAAGQAPHRVITKVDLSSLGSSADKFEVRRRVDESIASSRRALRADRLDTLLLHLWAHRTLWSGAAWDRLLEHRAAGTVGAIGASVYEPGEALDALRDPRLGHLQIPMSVLDWRWRKAGVDQAISDRPDVVVHARSVLLQGVLVHPPERWPAITGFDPSVCVHALRSLAQEFGRSGVADLCFAYVRSLPWVTSVVVGCETLSQLEQNINCFLQRKLTVDQLQELENTVPTVPVDLLNPSMWQGANNWTAAYAS